MAHHSYDEGKCFLCEIKLKTAHPIFQKIWPQVKEEFKTIHVSCAYRSAPEQELAFQQGRSRLHFPDSDHNKTDSEGNMCSRAVDYFFINLDGVAVFPPWQYLKLAEWFEKNDTQIGAGIRWTKFRDAPHFYALPSVLQP